MENTVLELTTKIKQLEQELKKLKDNNGYGLTREDKPEEFEAQAKNALPIVQEEHSMRIENNHHLDHLIIQGDNFHSLSALNYTHRGLIDVIYIDPPYNTGNKDFIYNDSFVDKEDSYRHSKRLSFINKRLKLAKNLLSDKGVIFISIDDNEQAQLKLLCDGIFGENNTDFMIRHKVADDSGKLKITYRFRKEHEYILVCYKNKEKVFFNKYLSDRNYKNEYNNPDNDYRGPYKQGIISTTEAKSISTGKNFYTIKTPSGKEITRQWRINKEEWDNLEKDKRIYYGKDGNSIPSLKVFINEQKETTPTSILGNLGTAKIAGFEIENIFGNKRFTYPKPTILVNHLIKISSHKNSTVLDFFAGSGTTGHAVLELNKEDGGERKFILCSNRENTADQPDKNICKDITYERVKRVMTGYKNSKGEQVAGLGGGNLRYYTTQFVQKTASTDDLRYRFIHLCDDLLCIKEDTFTPIDTQSHSQYLKIFQKDKRYTIVLYDIHHFDELLSIIGELDGTISIYIFALSKDIYEEELLSLNKKIIVQNIPDDILQTYKKIFKF